MVGKEGMGLKVLIGPAQIHSSSDGLTRREMDGERKTGTVIEERSSAFVIKPVACENPVDSSATDDKECQQTDQFRSSNLQQR